MRTSHQLHAISFAKKQRRLIELFDVNIFPPTAQSHSSSTLVAGKATPNLAVQRIQYLSKCLYVPHVGDSANGALICDQGRAQYQHNVVNTWTTGASIFPINKESTFRTRLKFEGRKRVCNCALGKTLQKEARGSFERTDVPSAPLNKASTRLK
jgi:hypothetical protein